MLKTRKSFDLPAFYPLLDQNIVTKIKAEGDAEAAYYCWLVVAEVGVQLHVWLDEVEEQHGPITVLIDQHLCKVEESQGCKPASEHKNLKFFH